jgi:hypothetical protein
MISRPNDARVAAAPASLKPPATAATDPAIRPVRAEEVVRTVAGAVTPAPRTAQSARAHVNPSARKER